MKLKAWLEAEQMSQSEFAKLISSDQGHVSRLVTGEINPTIATVALVEKVTSGGVRLVDWIRKIEGELGKSKQKKTKRA